MSVTSSITAFPTGPQTSNIQVRSIPTNIRRGEDVDLVCEVENEPAAAISWRRMDGELPLGAQAYGNRLRIPNAQTGGIYLCTATTRQGVFEERYSFIIRGKDRFCDPLYFAICLSSMGACVLIEFHPYYLHLCVCVCV